MLIFHMPQHAIHIALRAMVVLAIGQSVPTHFGSIDLLRSEIHIPSVSSTSSVAGNIHEQASLARSNRLRRETAFAVRDETPIAPRAAANLSHGQSALIHPSSIEFATDISMARRPGETAPFEMVNLIDAGALFRVQEHLGDQTLASMRIFVRDADRFRLELVIPILIFIAVIARICLSDNKYAASDYTDSGCPGKRTVVLVHGWMSCGLLTNMQLCYINLTRLWLRNKLELKTSKGRLSDGTEVTCTANANGNVRVVTGTKGIRTLNPGHWFPIKVFEGLVDALCPHYQLLAINYDWRRWGDETYMEEYVSEFRGAIEAVVKSSGAVSVVSHSMGAPVVGYCLSKLGKDWQKRTIAQHITVAPAFGGAARTAHENASNVPDLSLGCCHFKLVSLFLQQSWPSTYTLLPQPRVGSVHINTGKPFLVTPSQAYKADDAGFTFVQDLSNAFGMERASLRIPLDMWSSIAKANQEIDDPAIPTYVICGIGVKTLAQVTYDNDQFSGKPDSVYEDGDGTMPVQQLRNLVAGWKAAGKSAGIFEFTCTSHRATVSAEFTISKVLELLRTED